MAADRTLIIGIDAGTSVIKAVAFDPAGAQVASAAVRNTYSTGAQGSATQNMTTTWADCVAALRGLSDKVEDMAARTAAVGLTGQGDGTWLVGADDAPVTDAWLWLDARAAPTVTRLASGPAERARFEATGTGLNTCQQGSQMAHMQAHHPDLLDRAEVALHCKDWLYLKLTGQRATDPSEASFTFGDFRSRQYSDTVIDALGLAPRRHLLPEIIDGTEQTAPLSEAAAHATGLLAGTPVSLGYVDMVMTALGAGVYTGQAGVACSTIGSTGVHMRAVRPGDVRLNTEGTGYVICLPGVDMVTQVQTNMAATLNTDWALAVAGDLLAEFGLATDHADLVGRIDHWLAGSAPGQLLYHPYISEAGERGPFVDPQARASLVGLNSAHRFGDVIRAIIEGLGMATRDCYAAMGALPSELRVTGGAARSAGVRQILGAALGVPVRLSGREEAGAAGCAMMAAVAIGAYDTMEACIADWTTPLLEVPEPADPALTARYQRLYSTYSATRSVLPPIWGDLAAQRNQQGATS